MQPLRLLTPHLKKDQLVPPGTGKLVNKSPATTLRQPYQTGSTGLPGTLGMIHENLYFLVLWMTSDLLFAILPTRINSSPRKSSYSEVTPPSVLGKATDLQDLKTAGGWEVSTTSCRTGALKQAIPCFSQGQTLEIPNRSQHFRGADSLVNLSRQHTTVCYTSTSTLPLENLCAWISSHQVLMSKVSHSQSYGLWSSLLLRYLNSV